MRRLKLWKSCVACVLTGAMLSGLLTGCGSAESDNKPSSSAEASEEVKTEAPEKSEEAEKPEEQELTYPLEGDITLTLAMVDEAPVVANSASLFDTPFGKKWQEETGVKIELIQLADTNAMNLLFAGGELPDLVYYNFSTYSGGAEKAIKDKVIEPLNDYMEFAPDLQKVLDSNEEYAKSNTTNSGDIIGFPFIRGDEYLKTSSGLFLRADWLEDLDMEAPQTPDELYEVLKAFKTEKGAESPLGMNMGRLFDHAIKQGIFTSPFGLVKGDFYQKDGVVHWGVTEPEYKDVLVYLNKLYTEGLLEQNFQSIELDTVVANMMNGVTGAMIGTPGGQMGTCLNTMKDKDPEFDLVGAGPLVAKAGDVPMSTHYDNAIIGWTMVITPACENKEAAAKFLNYGYTEAGHMLFNFGIEGESYTMVDGVPTYTDLIQNNPNGLSKQQAMAQYLRAWQAGPFVQDKEYMVQYSNLPQQQQALAQWTQTDAQLYQMPKVSIAEENLSEYSKLIGDANTYILEMTIKYVTGLESLDTFESEYMTTLKETMKVDRIIELQQAAVDLYNAR